MKTTLLLAIVAGLIVAAAIGVREMFIENEAYQLQELELKTDGYLSHRRFLQLTNIDTEANVLTIDLPDARQRILDQPEVISCEIERILPGTIKVQIEEREARAWVAHDGSRRIGSGVLLDKSGVPFFCHADYWQHAKDLPLIKCSDEDYRKIKLGEEIGSTEIKRALNLILLSQEKVDNEQWRFDKVEVLNFYSMQASCMDGTEAIFGLYDHDRQLSDLLQAQNHCKKTGRQIAHINLIPDKNIPVRFVQSPELPAETNTPSNQ